MSACNEFESPEASVAPATEQGLPCLPIFPSAQHEDFFLVMHPATGTGPTVRAECTSRQHGNLTACSWILHTSIPQDARCMAPVALKGVAGVATGSRERF